MPKLPLTFGKYLVMDANLNAVPYRIVAEAPLQVAGDTLGTEAARRVEVGPGTDPQVVYSRHIWVIATTQSDTVAEADISWDASSLHSVMWTAAALPYHWTPDGSLH
jgi:hypothetical protein